MKFLTNSLRAPPPTCIRCTSLREGTGVEGESPERYGMPREHVTREEWVAHTSVMSRELITHVHVVSYMCHGWKGAKHCYPGVPSRVMA